MKLRGELKMEKTHFKVAKGTEESHKIKVKSMVLKQTQGKANQHLYIKDLEAITGEDFLTLKKTFYAKSDEAKVELVKIGDDLFWLYLDTVPFLEKDIKKKD